MTQLYIPVVVATLGVLVLKMLTLVYFVDSFRKHANKSAPTYISDIALLTTIFTGAFLYYVFNVQNSQVSPAHLASLKHLSIFICGGALTVLSAYSLLLKRQGILPSPEHSAVIDGSEEDLVHSMFYVVGISISGAVLSSLLKQNQDLMSSFTSVLTLMLGAWGASTLVQSRELRQSRTLMAVTAIGSSGCLLL